jgi:bla regulator protein BlaR1
MFLLFFHQWIPGSVVKAFSWTLIHSLWQGLAAAVVAGLIVACTRKSAASLRYNLFALTLLVFIIISAVTFVRELAYTNNIKTSDSIVGTINSVSTKNPNTVQTDFINRTETNPLAIAVNYFNEHAPIIVLAWFMFFLVKFIQLFAGLRYIHLIRTKRNIVVEGIWKQRLSELAVQTGIRQSLIFLQSGLIKIPVVIGVFKPAILVPIGMFTHLPAEQVEAVLLHELAHIKRKDFLVNLLQSFTEVIFFFNPAITWISSLIREERESCCDDIVVKIMPRKKSYLEALVSFQDYPVASSVHAMAFGGRKNYLLHRVQRMLTQENKKLNIMEKTVLVLGMMGIMAFSFITNSEKNIPSQTKPVVSLSSAMLSSTVPAIETKPLAKTKPVAIPDTVPKKKIKVNEENENISFPNLSSNTNDDGNTRTTQIQATDNNGKKYSIRKVDGEVTDFSVDGKKIPKGDYSKYDDVLSNIDGVMRSRNRQMEKQHMADDERRNAEMHERLSEMVRRQEKMQEGQQRMLEKRQLELSQRSEERMREQQTKLNRQERLLMNETIRQDSIQTRQMKEHLFKMSNSLKAQSTRDEIHGIISELSQANLIPDKANLSFTLNNDELIVNGKKASAEIHQQLKEKYISKSGDFYKYSRAGNSESTTINKE